jgi:hypothetical protein
MVIALIIVVLLWSWRQSGVEWHGSRSFEGWMAAADAILQRLVLGNRAVEGHGVVVGAPPF